MWKTKNFNHLQLRSTSGRDIKILNWGTHNFGAGPDFLDALITYDGVSWAGHIEIHVKSSDWYRHHHQVDPAYDQVVLHVVWEDDRPVTDIHLNPLPTLVLKDLVDPKLFKRTSELVHSRHRIACAKHISGLSTFWLNAWKERQLVERLEYRTMKMLERLDEVNGDWEQVTFERLFRSMGFHANSDELESLARDLTWRQMRKVMHDPLSIQALLFGRAGLLHDELKDEYVTGLKNRYNFIKKKFSIASPVFIKWNFKGARPANFPTIRLAQLASILENRPSLIRNIIESKTLEELRALFSIKLPNYWQTHYVFGKAVDKTRINMTPSTINVLLINYAIPVMYAYGYAQKRDELKERAIRLLYALPDEKNAVIKEFVQAGVGVQSAADTQALLHTYREFCSIKKCLDCQVGARIVGKGSP